MCDRREFQAKREFELPPIAGGRPHYAELRMDPKVQIVQDFSIGYRVWHNGEYVEIVRYDCVRGHLHRHAPGFPEPGDVDKTFLDSEVPASRRAGFVMDEIRKNCETWQSLLPIEREKGVATHETVTRKTQSD